MPKNDNWGQNTQYPVLSDAPDLEIAFSTLVNGLVPRVVMRFKDANARAAALTGATKPVPGMITYLIAEDRWEGRQGDGTWLLLSDGPWQPLTFKSGYAAHSGSPGWRKKAGGGIELRGRIKRTNGGPLTDNGDLVPFASIPGSVAPAAYRYFQVPAKRITVSGITRFDARVEVTTDGTLQYTVANGGGVGTAADPGWIAIDGIQFSPAGD